MGLSRHWKRVANVSIGDPSGDEEIETLFIPSRPRMGVIVAHPSTRMNDVAKFL